MKQKPSGGCALRAKEIWPLKRPRSGARARLAGLFPGPWKVCDQGITASKIKHEMLRGFIITVGWLKQGEQTNVRVAETDSNLCR